MTQLTKQERKTLYKKLLKIVCATPELNHGFCYYIEYAVKEMNNEDILELYDDYVFDGDFIEAHLPELLKIKPADKETYDYWFPLTMEGWQKRINKLHNTIQRM